MKTLKNQLEGISTNIGNAVNSYKYIVERFGITEENNNFAYDIRELKNKLIDIKNEYYKIVKTLKKDGFAKTINTNFINRLNILEEKAGAIREAFKIECKLLIVKHVFTN